MTDHVRLRILTVQISIFGIQGTHRGFFGLHEYHGHELGRIIGVRVFRDDVLIGFENNRYKYVDECEDQ